MTPTVTLRDARPDDLEGIVAVFLGCWHVTYAETLPAATVAAMTPAGAWALWSRVLGESAPGEVIVAEVRHADGETAVAGVSRWAPSGWIHSLYVDPAAQGTGIGSLLLAESSRRIGRAGATTAHLWVFRDNSAGRRFYGRHGWSPDGTTRVEAEFGAPELRLTRLLEPPPDTQRSGDGPLADLVSGLVDGTVATPSGGTPPAGLAVAVCSERHAAHAVAGRRTVHSATTSDAPLTLDTLHDMASVTKILATTTAVLRLVSAGQLRLDDPAVRFLPGFGDGAKGTITVRDLLHHRAGLWEWHPLYAVADGDPSAADAFVDRLDLRYPPRQARHYSDLGFVQLGRIVASVAGVPLDRAVAELVTEPLGLVRTTFARPAGPLAAMSAFGDDIEKEMLASGSPYPVPFGPDDFGGWRDRAVLGAVNDGNAFHAYGGVAGHAGLFSDLADMTRFALAFGESEAHAAIWRPDVVGEFVAAGPDAAQALGFRRYPLVVAGRPTTLVGHTGFVGCALGVVPGRPVAVAMASNRLVTAGRPVPIDELWTAVLQGAAAWITQQMICQ
jgi:serine-type D-Ala-D-Ala carboxypeptidase